ncbi:MAG: tRNA (adenosine(37)-N6)-threonylcarbamoyltransferase complex dimerization subunit type 1 TsaB [Chloroflexi bacterium]|nr:tRNA (adenosine(37)-N6)-threonylcarbamoyltransferase complex dimerization subunit type 1 TsaB [Chloroflexota bacterium]
MLVAIDTSTKNAGVALYDQRGVIAELNWQSGPSHTSQVLPALEYILSLVRADRTAIEAVAVATGPGSFSGLRAGISLGKGLCLAQDQPIIGVGTLEATAYPHQGLGWSIVAAIAAGRGKLGIARYHPTNGSLQLLEGPLAATFDQLLESISQPTLVCGELTEEQEKMLAQRLGDLVAIPSPALSRRRVSCVAEIGWQRLRQGQVDDLILLEPVYLDRLGPHQEQNR